MNRKTSTTAPQPAEQLFSSKFLEDFVPEKWLGRGGYGVVFNCRNRLDDRSYAVKRIAVSNTTTAIDHVKREARAMARLDHPGIIRYFHTWMERPPSGWQQTKDKEILQNIRFTEGSGNKFAMQTLESEQNITESKNLTNKACVSKELLYGLNLNTSINEKGIAISGDADNLSWISNDNDSELRSATESDSSSLDINNMSTGPGITAVATGSDDSTGIIFAHCRNSLHSTEEIAKKTSRNSTSLDPLQPPAVLVTSMCDLQSCRNIKDYVYLYIQMELCQELTLHSWLLANNKDKDREITRMRKWLAELVCAIDYIHSQGLIHRDLKPQNIFFSADNYLKIGDLGLVTNYINEERTDCKQNVITDVCHTSHVGTRLYMSPEQLKGKPYNEKVDVFSLGLIFVELIVPCKTIMERNSILSGLQNEVMPKCLDNFPSKEVKDGSNFFQ
ncbi:other/PEK/PEK protein kinase [Wuchereria bancrofti]|uniref:Other/PEK/PEK protein kinase n=2 Tax=Wuchereria bancrofti TaxID=6293 RepID=J9B9U6_WUCBA|nr:other/PEK/PEK protein kinase [Wuchereria bancrofti]